MDFKRFKSPTNKEDNQFSSFLKTQLKPKIDRNISINKLEIENFRKTTLER